MPKSSIFEDQKVSMVLVENFSNILFGEQGAKYGRKEASDLGRPSLSQYLTDIKEFLSSSLHLYIHGNGN